MKKKAALLISILCVMTAASGCGSKPAETDVTTDTAVSETTEITEETTTAASEIQTEVATEENISESPLSAEAQKALEAFRLDLDADHGYLGAAFLGCEGSFSGNTPADLFEKAKMTFAGEVFTDELDKLQYISAEGEEVYLLVPADKNAVISVYEYVWSDIGDNVEFKRGNLLCQCKAGEPVIVKGNISDIAPNLEISVTAGGEEKIYHPSLSLENGKLSYSEGVVDFSRYESHELTFTADSFAEYAEYDWQYAYFEILDNYNNMPPVSEYGITCDVEYTTYDIDKNGIPELFVKYGTCEADYQTTIYYAEGRSAISAGDLYSGHTSYYSYPDGNGFVDYNGHMGYAYMTHIRLENGGLVGDEKPLLEEDINNTENDYTPVSSVVTGAEYLSMCYSSDILRLVDGGEYLKTCSYQPESREQLDEIFGSVLSGDRNFYSVYTSHFNEERYLGLRGDMNMLPLYEKGGLMEYAEGETVLEDKIYADINGDGQDELVAIFGDTGSSDHAVIIFSYQNGNVYGYIYESLYGGTTTFENGRLIHYTDYYSEELFFHFYLDQCYTLYNYD